MLDRFPRGSEWRKWDLHLHPPGTKLSNGYAEAEWPQFCEILENSDVVAFGIADYFCFEGFKRARREFAERFPQTEKLLLPNLELRLNEHVNKAGDLVDMHVILRPDTPDEALDGFLAALPTQLTSDRGRQVKCSELRGDQFNQATVSRADLVQALEDTFGTWGPDDAIIIVPASNSGIRAEAGVQRKASLADELDKFVDAIFGGHQNTDWYLRTDRFEDSSQTSRPKPVFACSDAHDLTQLQARLGQTVEADGDRRETTWIKADPTFEGLVQTFIEPSERVRIQPAQPDLKEPYKVISRVQFSGDGFPSEAIELNPNLVSIIGSRSSGKSALLAYISHAVDPSYTERQQVESGIASEATAGPAAGLTWADVSGIRCEVVWGTGADTAGRVVYIPQNSLFTVSERPREITGKLLPALFRIDPDFEAAYKRARVEIAASNVQIRDQVERWFDLSDRLRELRDELRDLGDATAVKATSRELAQRIDTLRQQSELTPEEVEKYEAVVESLIELDAAGTGIRRDQSLLDAVVSPQADGSYAASDEVHVQVARLPASLVLPDELGEQLGQQLVSAEETLTAQVRARIEQFSQELDQRLKDVERSANRIRQDNEELISKNRANTEIDSLVQRRQGQDDHLRRIEERQEREAAIVEQQTEAVEALGAALTRRQSAVAHLVDIFQGQERGLDDMTFGIEHAIADAAIASASAAFNRQENTTYFDRSRGDQIHLEAVFADPGAFLAAIADGAQKLRQGTTGPMAATEVLTLTPDIEFYAQMQGDRIGGFRPSSMTPGKQALFALTLIINESEDEWPLLLDQPEDDLDSRSIYASIVPFLMRRKRDRQIIMVSHDANLVVGADSEQIVVANRHGDDRPNRDCRTFDYLTGSLEWSVPRSEAEFVLESSGTREHACEILDGGEEAFLKRRLKYKI